jgi:hypothetical protein
MSTLRTEVAQAKHFGQGDRQDHSWDAMSSVALTVHCSGNKMHCQMCSHLQKDTDDSAFIDMCDVLCARV